MDAVVYKNINTGEIVIAYRGSEANKGNGLVDWTMADLQIGNGEVPNQFGDASELYKAVRAENDCAAKGCGGLEKCYCEV